MTVQELKNQLNNFDGNTKIAVGTAAGRLEVKKASEHEGYITLWTSGSDTTAP